MAMVAIHHDDYEDFEHWARDNRHDPDDMLIRECFESIGKTARDFERVRGTETYQAFRNDIDRHRQFEEAPPDSEPSAEDED